MKGEVPKDGHYIIYTQMDVFYNKGNVYFSHKSKNTSNSLNCKLNTEWKESL